MSKPEIRFKGYTDDWEQRKLEKLQKIKKDCLEKCLFRKEGYYGT